MHAIQNQNQFLYSNINFKTQLGFISSALNGRFWNFGDHKRLVNILIVWEPIFFYTNLRVYV